VELEQQNSTVENNEDSAADEVDVVEKNLTTSLMTDFINKLNDAMDI
jgi:hypothetical protein